VGGGFSGSGGGLGGSGDCFLGAGMFEEVDHTPLQLEQFSSLFLQ
jgi:hypothetical protein